MSLTEKVTRDTSNRRRQITEMLREIGSVQVVDLSSKFGVSLQTIRKDLVFLEELGVAARAYGGAVLADVVNVISEPNIEIKKTSNIEIKDRIGKFAASLVKSGDAIMLDSGTTTLQIAHYLPDIEDITVVTNDFNIVSALAQKVNINVVLLGGNLRRRNFAFYGAQTVSSLDDLILDKVFLGVDGFDVERGVTTHYEPEAQLNRKMVETAREVIAVCDSSKFSRVCLHKIAEVRELDILITDKGSPEEIATTTAKLNVKLCIVD